MKKIVFVCLQKEIIEDLTIAAMMDMSSDIDIHCLDNTKDLEITVAGLNPDMVVLSYDALKTKTAWDFKNIPVAYHAKNKDELREGARYGYPTIGASVSANKILDSLKKPAYKPQVQENNMQKEKNIEKQNKVPERKKSQNQGKVQQKPLSKNMPNKQKEVQDLEEFETEEELVKPQEEYEDDPDLSLEDEYEDEMNLEYDLSDTEVEENSEQEDIPEKPVVVAVKKNKEARASEKKKTKRDIIEEGFRKDSGKIKEQTKVITVYSAKGGVGKTTIASELATYLALVNVGRRKLRVCIVDYNIDFGDVRSTVHMGTDGLTLTNWAEEVQELIEKGRKPEDIQYSRDEIEEWLRKDKKSGLYVLPAPITNEDSMGIETESLSIILDNIIENGEFDYVICDTGNNTRDSTMVALEKATTILLIMTQNVNTANCDKAFIETMNSIDFDLSHTKLVINNIMPQKSTSVSVQEIVEFFPYDCVGKLKFNTDVIKAGNLGEPLAFHPEHEFTKQLRSIVSYILQESNFDSEAAPEKKKSLFEKFIRAFS